MEGIGILACFAGVLMIASAADEHPDEVEMFDDTPNHDEMEVELFDNSKNTLRLIGIFTMLFVAANDASLNVLARTMKDLHYSLIQFWFSAIGLAFLIVYIIISCCVRGDWPTFFYYDGEQILFLVGTGVFSALNLTCLVIAYQNDGSAFVSLLAYIALVYAFLADITIFKLTFVAMEISGAAVITFFNVFTIWYKMKYAPESVDDNDS